MRSKLFLILTTIAILGSSLLAGCAGSVAPEEYDRMAAQLQAALSKLAEEQNKAGDIQSQKQATEAALAAAQARIAELQGQVSGLIEQYELVGATPAETAERIVRDYHETHVYDVYGLFICSDMSSEVWNMLKAQGINAIIVVGNKDTAAGDILLSNHAWVLAEVSPGEYLALETTGGYVVPRSQKPLYYRGWSFNSPADLKANNDLVKEYNVRVEIRNQIAAEKNEVMKEHNQATNQSMADKFKAVYDKLSELLEAQEAELNRIKTSLDGLATELG